MAFKKFAVFIHHSFLQNVGTIALLYPPSPIVIDDSSWKNAAESFTVALTLTLGGYESAIAPKMCRNLHCYLTDLHHKPLPHRHPIHTPYHTSRNTVEPP